ncbi:MAG: beta-galactosidase trimerization domain-containing protein, partial [Chloroflexi bacterium]|nr:beta-galactosidase trimerization domain-containing protein [Chloroflexota bacterium]
SKLGAFLKNQSDFLTSAHTPQGEVAILESKPNAIFLRGVNQEEVLFQAQRGTYRAFWDLGFSVDFITPAQLSDKSIQQYKYICLPLMGLLDEKNALLLENYVSGGGILIGTARLATQDDKGWFHFDLPLNSLGRVFGISAIEADILGDHLIKYQKQTYNGAINRDLITPKESTEVLASFSDGKPAVTRASLGNGFGVYIGTQADIAYLDKPGDNLLGNIIQQINKEQAIEPRFLIKGKFTRARGIDPHILETDQKTLILFSNYLVDDQSGEFGMELRGRQPEEINKIYPQKSPQPYHIKGDRLTIPLTFTKKEVVILELGWKH